ncbi:universal stress protein [Ekhidna sp.]|uniref:universal stress protein n=1 Tax=Ekhidna sp. TaxID=2608089 RepID=UPI0032EFB365
MKTKIENIIVPFDSDEVSMAAANYAVALAKKEQAKVVLFYVIEHPTEDTFSSMGVSGMPSFEGNIYIEKLIEKTEERMMKFINAHKEVEIKWHIKIGHPYDSLTEIISHEKCDLLVMGTHEAKNGNHGFIQSHTEKIVNHSVAPVIVMREAKDFLNCKSILLATDFRDLNAYFMNRVIAMQKLTGARLKVVKVNTPTYFKTTDEDEAQYHDFKNQFELPDHDFQIFNDYEAEEGIVKVAKAHKVDLIMVGNHRRSGIHRLLLHNTVENLIRQTDIPVWTWRLGLND